MKGFGNNNKSKKRKKYKLQNQNQYYQILDQAIKYQSKGFITQASELYEFLIKNRFKESIVFANYGIILINSGKLKEAEESFQIAIKLNPKDEKLHSNLGGILKDLGKLKDAELSIRKAIEIKPDCANAHLNLGNILSDLDKLEEAEMATRKAIELNPNLAIAYSNLGGILKDLGRLEEAKLSTRKAIEINPNLAKAHSNLGSILKDLGKLKDAEVSMRRAIELNPNLAIAYYSLSLLKIFQSNKILRDQLFSKKILIKNSKKEQVNIYFARANVLHSESNFKESSRYLQLANNIKKNLNPTNFEYLLKRSKELMFESDKQVVNDNKDKNFPESIFIVGMPRSGSTLLESILGMNSNVNNLGEKNIFEESFLNWKASAQKSSLADLYFKKIYIYINEFTTTTNKWLFNYLYTGIISTQIPNSKIIHCFRNPLDNILSIYRANFGQGNQYSSSLIDSAKLYLDQEEVMTQYKKKFRSKIFDLNYDSLASNPNQEIKSLISWLGWQWEDQYLSPHLNPRAVSTASAVQVRSPINSKSIGGWQNYKEMLKPAMEIISQKDKYKHLKY